MYKVKYVVMGPHAAWHALAPLTKAKKNTQIRRQEDLP